LASNFHVGKWRPAPSSSNRISSPPTNQKRRDSLWGQPLGLRWPPRPPLRDDPHLEKTPSRKYQPSTERTLMAYPLPPILMTQTKWRNWSAQ
jgi:hypothetical protein